MGAGGEESLCKHAINLLKPRGGATYSMGLRDLGDDAESEFPAQVVGIPLLFDVKLPFPLHSSCGVSASTHWESEGFVQQRSPTGWDALSLSSQGNHYGELLPFPSLHVTQGEYLALLLAC